MTFPLPYIEYCALPRYAQIGYKIADFFRKVFKGLVGFFVGIWFGLVKIIKGIGQVFKKMYQSFRYGDWATKLSFLFIGTSNIKRGQIVKGILMMLFEIAFILIMIFFGGSALVNLITLGEFRSGVMCPNSGNVYPNRDAAKADIANGGCRSPIEINPDNSPQMLLYGILAVALIIIFITYYFKSVTQSYEVQTQQEEGRHIKTFKEDIGDFLNSKFHITLLVLPIIGVIFFSILPLLDMICMAFTNYDYRTEYPKGVFDWVGLTNFAQIADFGGNGFGYTFIEILKWTLAWAVIATFTNFIIGILIATIINRKGIKFKKFWRTCLVLSVAVPQFVSLLAISQFLNEFGPLTTFLKRLTGNNYIFLAQEYTEILFFGLPIKVDFPRLLIILINIWIGVPYTVLSTTGILMNVPEDLYESARIDGASPITMYFKITLRYIIFVMGPSLITTFIGNVNSFGVIFLLTGGGPKTNGFYGAAGHTDLLVTWLYHLTTGSDPDYKMASVVGILIFIVSATISLILYRNSSSFKSEEDFA